MKWFFVVLLCFLPEAFGTASARKKAGSQKKLLMLTAAVSAGAGIYLLATQCNPSPAPVICSSPVGPGGPGPGEMAATAGTPPCTGSPTPGVIFGCILGPLALAQAVINYKQAKDMGKLEDQLAAKPPDGDVDVPIPTDGEGNPTDIPVPCPGDHRETCILTKDGLKVTSPKGGSETPIANFAAMVPTNPKIEKLIKEAMAGEKQQELLKQAREIDPDFDPSNMMRAKSAIGGSPFFRRQRRFLGGHG